MGSISESSALFLVLISLMALTAATSQPALADSQAPQLQWSKSYAGDGAGSIIQSPDGGFAIVGLSKASLIKVDSSGEFQWKNTYGQQYGIAVSVTITSDSGFAMCYLGSLTSGTLSDGWFLKINSNGNVEWNKTIGVHVGYSSFTSLIQTSDGGFALASSGTQWNMSGVGALLKTDENGNVIWEKIYGFPVESAIQTNDMGYALISLTGDERQGVTGTMFVKTDSKGKIEFSKNYENIISSSLIETEDKGFLLWGYTGFTAGVVEKINSTGSTLWRQTFSMGEFVSHTYVTSVTETSDGGCIIAATLQTAKNITCPFFARIGPSGNVMWNLTSNEENTFSVITTADGGFAAAGPISGNVWLDKFVVPSLSTVHQTTPISTASSTVPNFRCGHFLCCLS